MSVFIFIFSSFTGVRPCVVLTATRRTHTRRTVAPVLRHDLANDDLATLDDCFPSVLTLSSMCRPLMTPTYHAPSQR